MMSEEALSRKRAELEAIRSEIESERARRILPEPATRAARNKRRLVLEREIAAAEGVEYADELPFTETIGDEWHLISNLGRDTALLCGDAGRDSSVVVWFKNTEVFWLSGLEEGIEGDSLVVKGLDIYGAFLVRHSAWRARTLATMRASLPFYDESWWSGFEHYVFRGKGGDFCCLARGFEYREVPVGIEQLRKKAQFWKELASRPRA